MKTSCRDIDITNVDTVSPWVYGCICKHCKRYDFRKMLCSIGGMTRAEYDAAVKDHTLLISPSKIIAEEAVRQIKAHKLDLKPVHYKTRVDKSTLKVRKIGCEDAFQQVLDHIAVNASTPIWKRRIAPQQVSSVKGRGPVYGTAMISRWLKKDRKAADWARRHNRRYTRQCKYAVKMDVQQCFPSMRAEVFLKLFSRDCGSPDLVWLWEQLLRSYRVDGYEGFMIGALPSQWGAQYVLSFIYNYAVNLHSMRRGKRVKWVSHALLYMDDILLTGPNRRNLVRAAKAVTNYAARLGLSIKAHWQVTLTAAAPIDMMGYVVHEDGNVTVRDRVFLRTRRIAQRILRAGTIARRQALRLVSYKGYFYHKARNSRKILTVKTRTADKKYELRRTFRRAENVIKFYNWKGMVAA